MFDSKSWEMNLWLLVLTIIMTNFMRIYFSTALFIDRFAHIWVSAMCESLENVLNNQVLQAQAIAPVQQPNLHVKLQNYASRDKTTHHMTKLRITRQNYASRDKTTRHVTKLRITWQNYASRDKTTHNVTGFQPIRSAVTHMCAHRSIRGRSHIT